MISGHGTIETAVRSTKLGAFDFIEKPLSIDKTLLTLRHALEQSQLAAQNRELREELRGRDRIIGDSVPMKALRQQLQLAAPTHGRVLIYGESGTGKELVAHALHNHSQRAEQPFVEVNCAAIPEELIESELFGHIKGSFTGALEDKTGKFEQAHGGSLFLDEVGDMSLRTQSKVLRVIEEQRFTPVGSGNNLTVDVRIIAATNKHLEDEIQKGNFREDLFYRLNVIPFYVPPAARARGGHPHAGQLFPGGIRPRLWAPPQAFRGNGDGNSDCLSLAGKRARTQESRRAPGHHGARRAHRAAPSSPFPAPGRSALQRCHQIPHRGILQPARSAHRLRARLHSPHPG